MQWVHKGGTAGQEGDGAILSEITEVFWNPEEILLVEYNEKLKICYLREKNPKVYPKKNYFCRTDNCRMHEYCM